MTIEKQTYEQMRSLLPIALVTAINSYRLFMAQAYTKDCAEHKNYHQAQKICLAHIEHLARLIENLLSGVGNEAGSENRDLETALVKARAEIDLNS